MLALFDVTRPLHVRTDEGFALWLLDMEFTDDVFSREAQASTLTDQFRLLPEWSVWDFVASHWN